MSTRIVTGVDGSSTATEAAKKAARLALALDAELHVVSAYGYVEERTVRAENIAVQLTPKQDAQVEAEKVSDQLREEFPGLRAFAIAVDGRPAKALVGYAEEIDAELIVVGNKRVQSLARILGSIATDVAQKAHCDVYVAHTHA